MKKLILIVLLFLLLVLIGSVAYYIYEASDRDITYKLGDYGVEMTAPSVYKKQNNSNISQLLYLYNFENGITVSVTQLRGDFWSSGDIEAIGNQYVQLLSVARYDSSLIDVDIQKSQIDNEQVALVQLTLEKNIKSQRTKTILTPKSHGYLAIEVYANSDTFKEYTKEIDAILDTIKFSKNWHDYSKDVAKEQTEAEKEAALRELYRVFGLNESGELITSGE